MACLIAVASSETLQADITSVTTTVRRESERHQAPLSCCCYSLHCGCACLHCLVCSSALRLFLPAGAPGHGSGD
jgi:hypothetical protein